MGAILSAGYSDNKQAIQVSTRATEARGPGIAPRTPLVKFLSEALVGSNGMKTLAVLVIRECLSCGALLV